MIDQITTTELPQEMTGFGPDFAATRIKTIEYVHDGNEVLRTVATGDTAAGGVSLVKDADGYEFWTASATLTPIAEWWKSR